MKYAFIRAHAQEFRVVTLCRVLGFYPAVTNTFEQAYAVAAWLVQRPLGHYATVLPLRNGHPDRHPNRS